MAGAGAQYFRGILRYVDFLGMSEAELRHCLEVNPGWVNHRDKMGNTPLVTLALDDGEGDAL